MKGPPYTSKGAVISPCASYRYLLRRCWDDSLPPYVSGMLNPSTADANEDDATITRTVHRAAALGFGSLVVWNLYAFRATDPAALRSVADPIGPDNLQWIRSALAECAGGSGIAVVGWGSGGSDPKVVSSVQYVAKSVGVKLHCLGMTKDGHPRHPLYVSYDVTVQPWPFMDQP